MKKVALIPVVSLFMSIISMAQTNAIKVSSTGKVGINLASPTYQLDVAGNVRFTYLTKAVSLDGNSFSPLTTNSVDLGGSSLRWARLYSVNAFFTNPVTIDSDVSLKINITDLPGMKDKLKLLRPVSYQMNPDFEGLGIDKNQNPIQFGFIAQELQEIFPEMVVEHENGLLGVRYTELIPVLIQVVKEQQDEINSLSKRITELEQVSK